MNYSKTKYYAVYSLLDRVQINKDNLRIFVRAY